LSAPLAAAALVVLVCAGCVTAPPAPPVPAPPAAPAPAAPAPPTPAPGVPTLPPTYRAVDWSALPGWADDAIAEAWVAYLVGCAALIAPLAPSRDVWQAPCGAAAMLATPDAPSVRAHFEQHFIPYAIIAADGRDTGLVTGYYEPLLAGSRTRTAQFPVALFAPPDDLLTIDLTPLYPDLKDRRLRGRVEGRRVVPYWSRADIDAGRAPLDGKALVYVDDPVEAFFLQIQGSGRVQLADGSVIRVGYADQNGHPFRSVARVLIDRGEISADRASMQGIKAWARANPAKLPALLEENPSYVFFREVAPFPPGSPESAIDGPIGSLGVPLAAGRTIAVDTRSVPLGAPVWLATTRPLSTQPLDRLVLAQDTGGAIRGAVRADFFWGFGAEAGREAGRMRQDGRMWLLWPKGAALPAAPPPKP
jgi:membrane-bound lytic murein transglycosylase A